MTVRHKSSTAFETRGFPYRSLPSAYDGAFLVPDPQQRLTVYRTFLDNFSIVGLTDYAMEVFARERTALRLQGRLIPDMDLLIAATAITHDLTLVTRNTGHFSRIPDLKLYQGT